MVNRKWGFMPNHFLIPNNQFLIPNNHFPTSKP